MQKTIFILVLTIMAIILSLESYSKDIAVIENWGLANIQAQKALNASLKIKNQKKVTVAVIDTGMDIFHPALKNNLWVNVGESGVDKFGKNKSINGIDDDNNGFIDDVHGWNFVKNNNDLTDYHGHGTHISGIISSVANRAPLMTLKYYDPRYPAINNVDNIIKAIHYAIKMKADIINYSGGGAGKNFAEEAAIRKAEKNNILFVAAAGNEGLDSGQENYYPANYDLSNIISVASIDEQKRILASSNYGIQTVDIAAPGSEINSTLPGGLYGKRTGTSQATAFVTGVAVLLMNGRTDLGSAADIIMHLLRTGDKEEGLSGKTKYRVKLNSYRALVLKDRGVSALGSVVENLKEVDSRFFLSNPSEVFKFDLSSKKEIISLP